MHYDTCRPDRCFFCGGGKHLDDVCPFQPKFKQSVKINKKQEVIKPLKKWGLVRNGKLSTLLFDTRQAARNYIEFQFEYVATEFKLIKVYLQVLNWTK